MLVHKKAATIKQVAHRAGVSTQTVSRVINNRPDVAPETRDRVQGVITQLGYQPNALARSLIRQRSYALGVVVAGLTYYGPARTLAGIQQQAAESGYRLLLDLLPAPETDAIEPVLRDLLAWQVDGIVWAVAEIGPNHAWLQEQMPDLPAPVVFLNMEPRPNLLSASVDNRLCGLLATEHLLAQGRRDIGILTGPLYSWEAQQRRLGWQQALLEAGISVEAEQEVEGTWLVSSGEEGLRHLLEQVPNLDAVFASNDQMGLGVLTAARRLGIRVPDDLAVVGVDNIPESAYFYPPLTSVQQHLFDLGRTSVRMLVDRIDSVQRDQLPAESEPVWLQPELVIRESSGSTR